MLITHDMGVIAETADRVAVMYAGRIVEIGPVSRSSGSPAHPYTDGLMASIPSLEHRVDRLRQIDGAMPRLDAIPHGCRFHPRCPLVFDRCRRNSRNCWMQVRPGRPAGCMQWLGVTRGSAPHPAKRVTPLEPIHWGKEGGGHRRGQPVAPSNPQEGSRGVPLCGRRGAPVF